MKGLPQFACVAVLVATALQAAPPKREAAPVPDFWYVVPDGAAAAAAAEGELVRGIVIPSSVSPTVRTTPTGSVISWRRPDGTRQSFAVQGVSSFTFEPGPLLGTTYVPFSIGRHLQYAPDGCCACASWLNMTESIERLGCVAGCNGCGCEACICSPTYPCPGGALGAMTLMAHNDPAATMTFGRMGTGRGIEIASRGRDAVSFHGNRLSANLNEQGEIVINNPDSITLPGQVAKSESIRGDQALFAWSSPEASVILEQPRSMPAPSFQGGSIDFNSQREHAPAAGARFLQVEPDTDRCRVCGTHPNSMSDLTIYDCVPGDSVCYRCVSWEC
jgi:hypothetical protein